MNRIAPLAFAASLLPMTTLAQANPAAILVLDGSGSMWGQIDGVAKITIAQEVMGELMTTLPADLDLGLTVYGHRRKGDCSDIQTLVMPGPDTRAAITSAVNGIKPKGKTPMADAVVAAAQALRHHENAATVILVSDGIETCAPDVCAVARELEATGVDFTAHVVGFDVKDPKARAQFQCMAEATGGKFLSAANADELGAALTQVAEIKQPPPPEPTPDPDPVLHHTHFAGSLEPNGDALVFPARWEIFDAAGTPAGTIDGGIGMLKLTEGDYTVRLTRPEDGARAETAFFVGPGMAAEISLRLQPLKPPATLTAPDTAETGATISVTWEGPATDNDYLDTALPGSDAGTYITYEYVHKGNPVMLRMPTEPGTYDIRYLQSVGPTVLATKTITLSERSFGLNAPDRAVIGETINVDWTGSGFGEDYITLAEPGSDGASYETYEYVSKGNPVALRLTLFPGTYELRYINGQDSTIAHAVPITLTERTVTLTAPSSAQVGGTINVTHDGPAYDGDYITFAPLDSGADAYETYEYVFDKTSVTVPVPETPGRYALRYVSIWGDARALAENVVDVN